MPLFDYECERCGCIGEYLMNADDKALVACPKCPGLMHRIISLGRGENVFRDEAPWIKSVLEVVAKDSNSQHTREFLANPTRANYREWMRAEGLRPHDPGEQRDAREKKRRDNQEYEKNRATRLLRRHMERNRIEI